MSLESAMAGRKYLQITYLIKNCIQKNKEFLKLDNKNRSEPNFLNGQIPEKTFHQKKQPGMVNKNMKYIQQH